MKKNRYAMKMTIFAMILAFLFILSFFLGRYPVSPKELFGIVFSGILRIEPFWTEQTVSILLYARLPRILLACLVGGCLAAAGASYQGIFQNPMASPDFLGASSGAALGAALAILFRGNSAIITVSAFLCSVATVLLVIFVSKCAPGSRVVSMILAGIIISSLCSSGTSMIKLVADPNDQLPAITYWLMGSLNGTKLKESLLIIIPMLIGLIPLMFLRWRINLLTVGDEEAVSMGVNAQKLRVIVILCATLVTASSVAVSGMIGWIGLVIPHFARRLVGNNYIYLLPATILLGGAFLLLVDNVARNLFATEIPIGILTAIIGAPFFIYLFTRKEAQL